MQHFNWCWRRHLRVSWTARRTNQSILREINPDYSLEGLMLKLKLQYIGYLMQRDNSLEKTLMLGKIEGKRRRGWQRMRWLEGITNTMEINLSKFQEIVKDREAWHSAVHGVTESDTTKGLNNKVWLWPLFVVILGHLDLGCSPQAKFEEAIHVFCSQFCLAPATHFLSCFISNEF